MAKRKVKRRTRTFSRNQIAHRIYLKSDAWKKKKDEFRASSFFRGECFICKKKFNLHIHHLTYENWMEEEPEDLIELCGLCHKNIHLAEKKGIPFSIIIQQMRELGLVSISL